MKKDKLYRFEIEIAYDDDSGFFFKVELEGKESKVYAELLMITRGTLMATSAKRIIAYNEEGFEVCAYIQ